MRVYLSMRIVHNALRRSTLETPVAGRPDVSSCAMVRLARWQMTIRNLLVALCLTAGLVLALEADQPDERGWGWQVKASIGPATPRPFYMSCQIDGKQFNLPAVSGNDRAELLAYAVP
jgi:hypothetical protein